MYLHCAFSRRSFGAFDPESSTYRNDTCLFCSCSWYPKICHSLSDCNIVVAPRLRPSVILWPLLYLYSFTVRFQMRFTEVRMVLSHLCNRTYCCGCCMAEVSMHLNKVVKCQLFSPHIKILFLKFCSPHVTERPETTSSFRPSPRFSLTFFVISLRFSDFSENFPHLTSNITSAIGLHFT